MKTGLMLGGGGVVGIAWELGVMAGLAEHASFEPTAMDVIVGTSAGSVAGSQVALGKPLPDLVAHQQRPPRQAAHAPTGQGPSGISAIPQELLALFVGGPDSMEERALAVAKIAADVPLALKEDDYVASFGVMLGTDTWPTVDLRMSTVAVDTGKTVLWTRHDGVDLTRAVASSCAIPGFFPHVAIGGRRYMDGPRGPFYRTIVEEKSLDALLFIGPRSMLPPGMRLDPEVDELAEEGFPVVQITGGAALAEAGADLMNPAARVAAVNAGLDDGRQAAAAVAGLLG
ncbi:MAG TPA: patatin-like phospholipase family protein [Acidimicrobiales bacterium]|jgi:NTE family protein